MRTLLSGIALLVAATMALAACTSVGDSTSPAETPGGPTIVAVFEDVNWYPPCAITPIELGGDLYYPLPMDAPPVDESQYPTIVDLVTGDLYQEESAVTAGLDLPRLIPPGPGDDIGTVIVYSDGMARFESRSGNVAWLTREVQEYGYVC